MAQQNTIGLKIKVDGSQAKTEIKQVESAAKQMHQAASRPIRLAAPPVMAPSMRGASSVLSTLSMPSVTSGRSGGSMFSGIGSVVGSMASSVSGIGGALVSAGSSFIGILGGAFGIVGSFAGALVSAAGKFGSMMMDFLGKGVDMLMGLPKIMTGAFLAAGAAVGSVVGGLYATHKALSPAGEMERYKAQLDVMGKGDRLQGYKQAALKSPNSLNEIVGSGILLEAFGIDSSKVMSPMLDMAAAFKKPLEEVAQALGFAKSGRTGEAMERFRSMGITNEVLAGKGIKFSKSGEIEEASKGKLIDAVLELSKSRYGGMAEKMSGTYEGKISNLGDAIFQAFADGFEKVLPYAKDSIQIVTDTIGELGAKLASVDWSVVGTKVVEFTRATADLVKYLSTSEGMGALGDALSSSFNIILAGLPGIMSAMGVALYESFVSGSNYMMGKLFEFVDFIVSGMKTGGEIIAALLEHAIFKAGTNVSSILAAGLISVLPSVMLDEKGKEYAKMAFGDRVSAMNEETYSQYEPTVVESILESFSRDMETQRKSLRMGSGSNAIGDLSDKLKKLGIDAADPIIKILEQSKLNSERKAVEEKKTEAQQQKTEEVVAAVKAGNALTSQMLREMRMLNEYNQSELAEAMIA